VNLINPIYLEYVNLVNIDSLSKQNHFVFNDNVAYWWTKWIGLW